MKTLLLTFRNVVMFSLCLCCYYIGRQRGKQLIEIEEIRWKVATADKSKRSSQNDYIWWLTERHKRQRRTSINFSLNNDSTVAGASNLAQGKCRELWKRGDGSEWFSQNFDRSLKPIWTKDNINIRREVFDWWNKLTNQEEPTYGKVLSLVEQLALNPDPFVDNQPRDCITCAVVGNSGNLRKSGYGKLINDHVIIIRMNNYETVGFEEDVGNRTTHYIAYPLSFKATSMRNASFVLAAFSYWDMEWLNEKLSANTGSTPIQSTSGPAWGRNKVFLLNPEVMWQIKHKWGLGQGRWASTGVLSVFFALQMCDEVDVYGFGADSKGNWDHYFSKDDGEKNSAFKQTLVHDSAAEELLLQKLIEAKKITVYRGSR